MKQIIRIILVGFALVFLFSGCYSPQTKKTSDKEMSVEEATQKIVSYTEEKYNIPLSVVEVNGGQDNKFPIDTSSHNPIEITVKTDDGYVFNIRNNWSKSAHKFSPNEPLNVSYSEDNYLAVLYKEKIYQSETEMFQKLFPNDKVAVIEDNIENVFFDKNISFEEYIVNTDVNRQIEVVIRTEQDASFENIKISEIDHSYSVLSLYFCNSGDIDAAQDLASYTYDNEYMSINYYSFDASSHTSGSTYIDILLQDNSFSQAMLDKINETEKTEYQIPQHPYYSREGYCARREMCFEEGEKVSDAVYIGVQHSNKMENFYINLETNEVEKIT